MQMHLLDAVEHRGLGGKLAMHKLELCMILLSELRNTYAGADAAFKFFSRAQTRLLHHGDKYAADGHDESCTPVIPTIGLEPQSRTRSSDYAPGLDEFLNPDLQIWEAFNPFTTSWMTDEELMLT